MLRGRIAVVVLVAAASGAACSLLLDTSRSQCESDTDCALRGGPFTGSRCVAGVCVSADASQALDAADADADAEQASDTGTDDTSWGCLGNNPPPVPASSTIKYGVRLFDFLNPNTPVKSMIMRVCPAMVDITCANPLATVTPDKDGYMLVDLDVSAGPFAGYMLFEPVLPDGGSPLVDASDNPAANDNVYWPTLAYFDGMPLYADMLNDFYTIADYSTLNIYWTAYGNPAPDRNLGTVFLSIVDCQTQFASGVSFGIDNPGNGTLIYTLDSGIPSPGALSTWGNGTAGFINAPLGPHVVTATLGETGQRIGSATFYAIAGKLVWVNLAPEFTRK